MIRVLVVAALLALPVAASSADEGAAKAPPSAVERGREAIRTGVDFLVRTQNEDGSWGYHAQRSPYAIWAPVPGAHRAFKVGSSGLALMAVRRAPGREKALVDARAKGLEYLVKNGRVKRSHGAEIYAIWGWAYGLQAIARALTDPWPVADEKDARATAMEIVKALMVHQTVDGGFTYFDFRAKAYNPSGQSMSFTTATVLLALNDAKKAGIPVPQPMIERGLRSLILSRTPEGTYVYSFGSRYAPQRLINRPGGSLTRTPGNNLALHRFGRVVDIEEIERGVATLLRKKRFARMALHRPVPHQSWYAVSGYFYLYGYFYAAECTRLLDPKAAVKYRDGLIEEILVTKHPDGSFWDYPLYGYHKPYGTGFALMALARCTPPEK